MSDTEKWSGWGDRVYGSDTDWAEAKRRYWRSRWTIFRRCLWCRSGDRLQLNHLTYWTTKVRTGWTPLWFFVPLCPRCHRLETKWTRAWRRVLRPGAHVVVTFGVYLASRAVLGAAVWFGWPLVAGFVGGLV